MAYLSKDFESRINAAVITNSKLGLVSEFKIPADPVVALTPKKIKEPTNMSFSQPSPRGSTPKKSAPTS